ncbi:hypothetical protein HK100_006557 [Physocladia obscura]|uniref:Uncharacterized protein n=1 Tax=Physocladia obscura TaxID=109957 RepID=A0AAD5XBA4_9FUNG|nr:hypothetical protein HK100_006557 [Physocladia obscura]
MAVNGLENDLFIAILLMNDEFDEAISIVTKFHQEMPLHPNSCRYFIQLSNYLKRSIQPQIYSQMIKLDPKSELELAYLPLIEFKESQLDLDQDTRLEQMREILAILARRLDFSCGDEWTWRKLVIIVHEIRKQDVADGADEFENDNASDAVVWHDRCKWWTNAHLEWHRRSVSSLSSILQNEMFARLKAVGIYLVAGPSPRLKSFFENQQAIDRFSNCSSIHEALNFNEIETSSGSGIMQMNPSLIFTPTNPVKIPECLLAPPKRVKVEPHNGGTDLRINKPTTEEIIEFMGGDYGFLSDNDDSSSDDSDFSDAIRPEWGDGGGRAGNLLFTSKTYIDTDDEDGEIGEEGDDNLDAGHIDEREQKAKEFAQLLLKRKWFDGSDDDDDDDDREPENENTLSENDSNLLLQASNQPRNPKIHRQRSNHYSSAVARIDYDGVEMEARWGAVPLAAVEMAAKEDENVVDNSDDVSSDDDDEFDLEKELEALIG